MNSKLLQDTLIVGLIILCLGVSIIYANVERGGHCLVNGIHLDFYKYVKRNASNEFEIPKRIKHKQTTITTAEDGGHLIVMTYDILKVGEDYRAMANIDLLTCEWKMILLNY